MTKYLGIAMTMFVMFGFATGCPDGAADDSDAACWPACASGYVCLDGRCVPVEADADADDNGADGDADPDADTTETEDDGTTDEGTTSCSWVAGRWEIIYLPAGSRYTFTLEQTGCSLTGYMEEDTFTGEINESDALSLYDRTGTVDEDLTGNLITPTHMTGDWSRSSGTSGTWVADLQ